jgi:hypothetical protein
VFAVAAHGGGPAVVSGKVMAAHVTRGRGSSQVEFARILLDKVGQFYFLSKIKSSGPSSDCSDVPLSKADCVLLAHSCSCLVYATP